MSTETGQRKFSNTMRSVPISVERPSSSVVPSGETASPEPPPRRLESAICVFRPVAKE